MGKTKEVFKTASHKFGTPTWWRNPSTVNEPFPAAQGARHPCRTTKQKIADGCVTQLVFVGSEDARFLSVAPGSYIRHCTQTNKPGTLIPVEGPAESVAVAKSFCACVKHGGTGKSCAGVGKNTAVGAVAGLRIGKFKVTPGVAALGVAALVAAWWWKGRR